MVTRTVGVAKGCGVRPVVTVVLLVGCLLVPEALRAQERGLGGRPSSTDSAGEALVLGGGGSRGLAHAGVLLGLERRGYDPGLVVGTSMGAIIGALYAAGYTPEEVERIIAGIDWPRLFQPPAIALAPSEEPRRPMLRIALPTPGVRPQGLLPEAYIDRILVRLLFDAEARSGGDFDRLPRRFRAVAVELRTGERRVLADGDLARAVRASMAIPGLFPPVLDRDGSILVNGGITDNVAVDVARAAGARHVVASDVLAPDTGSVGFDAIQIGIRGLRLLLHVTRDTASADVTIRPPLPDALPALMFPREAGGMIRAGIAGVEHSGIGQWPLRPPRMPLPPPEQLAGPRIEGVGAAMAHLALDAFAEATRGVYSEDAVLRAVDRLYATGLVEGVWPRVDSAGALSVRVEPRPALQGVLSGGWETDRGWRGWLALQGLSAIGSAPLSATLAASADGLSRQVLAATRLHVLTAPLSLTGGAMLGEVDIRGFDGDSILDAGSIRRVEGWVGLEGRRFAPEWLGSLRLQGGRVEGSAESGFGGGPVAALEEVLEEGEPVGIPTKLEVGYREGVPRYGWAHARGSLRFHLAGTRAALVAEVRSVGAGAPADVRPALGDERRMPGLRWGEERGRSLAIAGLDVARSVPLGAYARIRLRTGRVASTLDRLDPLGEWMTGAEVALLWTTPFGNLDLAYGLASGRGGRAYVGAGGRF